MLATAPAPTGTETARLADQIEASAYASMFALAPPALRDQLGLRVEQVAGATVLLAPRLPTYVFNRVIGLGFAQPATPDDLRAIEALYRAHGPATGWWLHWNPAAQPAGFAAALPAEGYQPTGRPRWAKMLRATAAPPAIDSPLQVSEASEDDALAAARVIASAFDMPPFMAPWIAALRQGPWRLFALRDGGTVVGGGCLYVEEATGWLGVAGVAPSHRGRRGQAALMAARIAAASVLGATQAVTETGEPTAQGEANPSLDNMVRCGFRQVASRLNFTRVD